MKAGELIYAGINRKKYLKNNGLSFQYSGRQALKINIRCPQINNRTIPISTKRIFQPKNPFGASFNLLSRSIRSDQIGFDFIGRTSKKYAEAKIEIMMAQSDVHSAEMVDPPKPSFRVVGLLIKLFGLLITLMGWVGLTGIAESLAYQSVLNQSQLDLRMQGLQVSLGNYFIGIGISFMFIVVGLVPNQEPASFNVKVLRIDNRPQCVVWLKILDRELAICECVEPTSAESNTRVASVSRADWIVMVRHRI